MQAVTASTAWAAGGHHAVDDASILEPGQCQVEAWGSRGDDVRFWHLGAACRVGPVELGLNLERSSLARAEWVTLLAPQVKWATAIDEHWSVGAEVLFNWLDPPRSFQASTLVLPLTWQPLQTLAVHFNVGRDFIKGRADQQRGGAAIEWTPAACCSLIAERFREGGEDFWRAGLRWFVTPSTSIDLSHTDGVAGTTLSWWSLGLNWAFDR